MASPIENNSNTNEPTVHTFCYLGLRLTLCYDYDGVRPDGQGD